MRSTIVHANLLKGLLRGYSWCVGRGAALLLIRVCGHGGQKLHRIRASGLGLGHSMGGLWMEKLGGHRVLQARIPYNGLLTGRLH